MDAEQLKEVAEAFRSEAADYLATIQRDLLALEKETVPADRRKLEARLFRNCHSLKGSAGTLGFMEVERIAHHLEGALHNVQSGAVRLGPELTDAVLAALDAVRGLLEASAAGRAVPPAEVDAVAARLESAAGPVTPLAPHRPTQLPGEARPDQLTPLRNLAEGSKAAAGQVRGIIADIQKAMRAVVDVTEEGSARAAAGAAVAERTGHDIRRLVEAIRESSLAAKQIAAMAKQQNLGIESVAASVSEIHAALAGVLGGIQDLEATSQRLRSLNEEVLATVARFKVPSTPPSLAETAEKQAA